MTDPVTPAGGEWIKWKGGDCPLPPRTLTQIQMRYEIAFGRDETQPPVRAHARHWQWNREEMYDIVAYREVAA